MCSVPLGTTSGPPATTTTTLTVPRKCKVWGCLVCSDDGETCLQCNESNRFPVNGKCRTKVYCRRGFVDNVDEGDPPVPCKCKISDCHRCLIEGGQDGNIQCLRCKNSKLLASGICVDSTSCPEGQVPAGAGSFGRSCENPFECLKGRKNSLTGASCKCQVSSKCFACAYDEAGHKCTRCKASTFLHNGECVDSCPSELTHAGIGNYGRTCEAAFECKSYKNSITGAKCKCPSHKKCHTCEFRAGNAPREAVCTRCKDALYLHMGECIKECPSGFVSNGVTKAYGRECILP